MADEKSESEDKRAATKEENFRRGGDAAELLRRLHTYENESWNITLEKLAQEIGVTPETINYYALGLRPIPERHKDRIIDALRSFHWKVDPKWKFTTAISEALGINSRHFVDVDDLIVDAKPTLYKLGRLDRSGSFKTGEVTISPLGDAPRWWTYTYDVQNGMTDEVSTKEYSGPVFVVDRLICVICAGRGGPGVGKHLRMEYLWPSSAPKFNESFGISLSTFSREGHPLATPFVLIPMSRWNQSLSNEDEQKVIAKKLTAMTQNGMIHLFAGKT